MDPRTKELLTFGPSDRAKIKAEVKIRAMTEAMEQQAQRNAQEEVVDGSGTTQVDEYLGLFTKTLPRHYLSFRFLYNLQTVTYL